MKYRLLKDFVPLDSFDGIPGEDNHGSYILFPPNVHGIITASDMLQVPSGGIIQIQEEDSVLIDGTRFLKLYYK